MSDPVDSFDRALKGALPKGSVVSGPEPEEEHVYSYQVAGDRGYYLLILNEGPGDYLVEAYGPERQIGDLSDLSSDVMFDIDGPEPESVARYSAARLRAMDGLSRKLTV